MASDARSNVTVTYVVDHGLTMPVVRLGDEVNGGPVQVVAIGDLTAKLEAAEKLLTLIQGEVDTDSIIDNQIDQYWGGDHG